MKFGALLLAVVAIVLAVGGCQGRSGPERLDGSEPPTGVECTVQFRRDALGGSADIAGSPFPKQVNDVVLSVDGKIREVNAEWLSLESPKGNLWIPRDVILLIQVE